MSHQTATFRVLEAHRDLFIFPIPMVFPNNYTALSWAKFQTVIKRTLSFQNKTNFYTKVGEKHKSIVPSQMEVGVTKATALILLFTTFFTSLAYQVRYLLTHKLKSW